MQGRGRTGEVRNAGNKNLFDAGVVSVLKEHDRGINVFSQLLAADGYTAGVLEGAEQQKMPLIKNGDAGSARVHFNYQGSAIGGSASQGGQHRRHHHSRGEAGIAEGAFVILDNAVE